MKIKLSDILRPSTLRPIDQKTVDMLTSSMGRIGLIQPITVKNGKQLRGVLVDCYVVVAGNHRLLAAEALGWSEIDANVLSDDIRSIQIELIEIDENLCRSDLSAAQRSSAIKRRKQIWESLNPEGIAVAQIEPAQSSMARTQVQQFAADTSSVTGEAKSSINRHYIDCGEGADHIATTILRKDINLAVALYTRLGVLLGE